RCSSSPTGSTAASARRWPRTCARAGTCSSARASGATQKQTSWTECKLRDALQLELAVAQAHPPELVESLGGVGRLPLARAGHAVLADVLVRRSQALRHE